MIKLFNSQSKACLNNSWLHSGTLQQNFEEYFRLEEHIYRKSFCVKTRPPKVSPDCTSNGLSQPRRGQFLVQRPLLPAAAAAAQWSRRSYRCFSHSLIRPPCWRRVKAEKQFLSGANAAKNGPIHDDAPIWNTIEIFSNGNYLKEQVVFRKKKLDLFLVASLLWIQSTS